MIYPDRRELDNDDAKKVVRNLGTTVMLELEHGDYLITGNNIRAGIERVTNSGLIADILSGRLVEKLEGMSHDFDVVFLITEGLILPSKDGYCLIQRKEGISFSYYYGQGTRAPQGAGLKANFSIRRVQFAYIDEFLDSVSLRWVHRIIWTLGPLDTARKIISIDKYLNKPAHTLQLTRSKPFMGLSKKQEPAVDALSCFDGIGREKASVLLEGNTLLDVCEKSQQELIQIKGVGPKLAKTVYSEVRRKY